MRLPTLVALLATLCFSYRAPAAVDLQPHERILFVGDDFLEGDADQAFIETRLVTRFPDKDLVFRNLGYAGDTVRADARNLCAGWQNFGPEDQGFKRLTDLVSKLHPTLIFVDYGMTESFSGPAGLANFRSGLDRMLAMLTAQSNARIVLITPIRHERLPAPLPNPAPHNQNLELYVQAVLDTAAQKGYPVIDLFNTLPIQSNGSDQPRLTRDGLHLTAYGYWLASAEIEKQLGYPARAWSMTVTVAPPAASATGAEATNVAASDKGITFDATDDSLPMLPPPAGSPANAASIQRSVKVVGLKPGAYDLRIDGAVVASASADEWAHGVALKRTPADERAENLRDLIRQKNFDFFNDWRAQNDTYILGYRASEQGRNAPEISRFGKLADEMDVKIAEARHPHAEHYSLERRP